MPSVMEAPEFVEYVETHDLTIETLERPQPRRTHPGFWRTLAQRFTHFLTPTPRTQHVSSHHAHRPFETPTDLLARQYPNLYIRTFCSI